MNAGPSTVLITGASGFVGQAVARKFAQLGWKVHALHRATTRPPSLTGVDWHPFDSGSDLGALFRRLRPVVAIHLAAKFLPSHTSAQVGELVDGQIGFSARLFEALAQAEVARVISTGTAWEVGGPAGEPVNLYAALKAGVENLLRYYAGAGRWRAMNLRLFDTYGPGDPRGKLIASLLRAARGEISPLELSPGEQKLDLVQVDDVALAYVVAANRLLADLTKAGEVEVWAVSSGQSVPLREVVGLVAELSGARDFCRLGVRPYRAREVMEPWQGPRLPGWQPQIQLRDGLRSLLASAR